MKYFNKMLDYILGISFIIFLIVASMQMREEAEKFIFMGGCIA
jgi:hypothetical protein